MTTTTTVPAATAARPDPMPAGRLGMWLFLASEAMFFTGLLGGFVVLLSAVGQRPLFHASAAVLSKPVGVAQLALLAAGSAAVVAQIYLAVQAVEYRQLARHHTVAARAGDDLALYDGTTTRTPAGLSVAGVRGRLPEGYDVHQTTPAGLAGGQAGTFAVAEKDLLQDATYGPARNNFFASYYLLTVVHGLHVVGGLAATLWLLRRTAADPTATGNVALYWHFVNAVGVVALLTLYLA